MANEQVLLTAHCSLLTVSAMRQLKIAIVLLVAIALPSALAAIWQPLAAFDLVLVMVVYFALQERDRER